ncbi:MAG TPA: cation:proton antiporter [Acidimicrobiia bacterium]
MIITPSPHDQVLQLVIQLAILLGVARLLGEVARRFRQPAVVGEILAGVLLGPSVAGALAPALASNWIPATVEQGRLLEVVALLGAMLLLAVTGLETDVPLIRRRAGSAVGIAAGGLVLPFAAGLALGGVFPEDLVGDPSRRLLFAFFLATALAVSAIPVLASILLELGMMRRNVGQAMLAAGMIDDLIGWTVLGVVVALANEGTGVGALTATALTVGGFVAATIFVAPRLVGSAVRAVHSAGGSSHRFLSLALVLVFGWSALSQALHLEPVIGAFAMGVLLGRTKRLPVATIESIEALAFGVFAPIFFAVAGLKVDVGSIASTRLALLTLLVLGVAIVGKVAGAYLGARFLSRADNASALAYGIGLSARGAIGIVVATVGLSLEILTPEVFSMIVVMAVATSLMTPPALKAVLHRIAPDEDEAVRLRRESAEAAGMAGRVRRVLLTVRPRSEPGSAVDVQAAILDRLAEDVGLAVTVAAVAEPGEASSAEASAADVSAAEDAVRRMADRLAAAQDVTTKVLSGDPVTSIITEAAKGYDLVVLGATEATAPAALFGSAVDEIVRMVAVPALLVRGGSAPEGWLPRHILVPVDGTAAAIRAAELAFAIAGREAKVTVLHAVQDLSPVVSVSDTGPMRRLDMGHQVVAAVRAIGDSLGVETEGLVEFSPEPEVAILTVAASIGADLVVLSTAARTGTSRLFLGPRVERILAECTCAVAVLNS